jgi:protein phosphatase
LQELALATGDRLLFCTDGLSGLLREEEIKVILQQGQLQKVGDDLLAQALEKGGKDNVSLVLVDVD